MVRRRAVALESEILLLGGGSRETPYLAVAESFAPGRNEWRARAPMELARNRFAAVEVDGRVYVIGGYTENGNTASVEVYDPAEDRWVAGPPLALPRHGHAAVVQDGHVVVIGGYATEGENQGQTASVEVLVPGGDAWTPGVPLPDPRGFHGALELGGGVYVFQGRNLDAEPTLRSPRPGAAFAVAGEAPIHLRHRYVAIAQGGRAWLVGGEGEAEEEVVTQAFVPRSRVVLAVRSLRLPPSRRGY